MTDILSQVVNFAFEQQAVALAVVLVIAVSAFLVLRKLRAPSRPVVSYTNIKKPVGPGRKTSEADIGDASRPKITFLVASQTGTAEEYARRLSRDGSRLGFKTKVVDLLDYDPEDMEKEPFIFLVAATYGEGDPPDNAQSFQEWLMDSSRPDDLLKNVKFTVFSLGNKTYQHYQATGRKMDARMALLGAERIFERGEGDDDGTLEDDFLNWQARAWPVICEKFGITYREGGDSDTLERRFRIVHHDATNPAPKRAVYRPLPGAPDAKNPYKARMAVNKELFKSTERSCRHIEFDIKGASIRYEIGDHLGVYPENDPDMVAALAKRLGVELDAQFSLLALDTKAHNKNSLPVPCSYREAFTQHLEIGPPPRKMLLQAFAHYAEDEAEKAKLTLMAGNSQEGKVMYEKEIHDKATDRPYKSVLDVLNMFPSVKFDPAHLLELLPHMAVRYYSISSASKANPEIVSITAVVTGVCTNYFKRIANSPDARVPIFVRHSTFRLPRNSETPIVMVGPGTGIAPFRGFIQERRHLLKQGQKLGPATLFFGCRSPSEDYLYEDELKQALADGVITELQTAFSRQGPSKVYVQHLMEQKKDAIWAHIKDTGHFYVCGDASAMAKDVQSTLIKIVQECGNMVDTAAVLWVKKLGESNRLHQDVW